MGARAAAARVGAVVVVFLRPCLTVRIPRGDVRASLAPAVSHEPLAGAAVLTGSIHGRRQHGEYRTRRSTRWDATGPLGPEGPRTKMP
jgi:hypothetical protein